MTINEIKDVSYLESEGFAAKVNFDCGTVYVTCDDRGRCDSQKIEETNEFLTADQQSEIYAAVKKFFGV